MQSIKTIGFSAEEHAKRIAIFGQPVIATSKVTVADMRKVRHQLGRASKKAMRRVRALWWKSQQAVEKRNITARYRNMNREATITQQLELHAKHATYVSKHQPVTRPSVTAKSLLANVLVFD